MRLLEYCGEAWTIFGRKGRRSDAYKRAERIHGGGREKKPMEVGERLFRLTWRVVAEGVGRFGNLPRGRSGLEAFVLRRLRPSAVGEGTGKSVAQVLPRLLVGRERFGREIERGRHWIKDRPTCRRVSTGCVDIFGHAFPRWCSPH